MWDALASHLESEKALGATGAPPPPSHTSTAESGESRMVGGGGRRSLLGNIDFMQLGIHKTALKQVVCLTFWEKKFPLMTFTWWKPLTLFITAKVTYITLLLWRSKCAKSVLSEINRKILVFLEQCLVICFVLDLSQLKYTVLTY